MNNKNIDNSLIGSKKNKDLLREPYVISSLQIRKNTFLNEDTLYSTEPISKILYNKDLYKVAVEIPKIQNEINTKGYRCDEFKIDHNGLHVLFSGCSQTWGMGLLQEETWPKKLYNLISKKHSLSGYFNIGIPGSSLCHEIIDIFKYCKTYGVPEYIFINFPPIGRMYGYDQKKNEYYDGNYSKESFYLLHILEFQYYFMLQEYCNKNNIKLFTFSWATLFGSEIEKFYKNIYSFTSFYKIQNYSLANFINSYKKNNPNDQFAEIARDTSHLGTAYHSFWANYMFDVYKKNNGMV